MSRSELAMYFTRIAAQSEDSLALAGHLYAYEDEKITRVMRLSGGEWSHLGDLPEIVGSATSLGPRSSDREIAMMLRNGVVHWWRGTEHDVEIIDESRGLFFAEIRAIGSEILACGTGRQVFQRGSSGWFARDDGLVCGPTNPSRILTSVDGPSSSELLAVGTGGDVFHFDGRGWRELDSPTDFGLTRVLYVDGTWYVGGFHGLLMRGDPDGFEILTEEEGTPMITDLAWFRGGLWIATEFDLSRLEGSERERVDVPVEGEIGFGSLASIGNSLWSVGGESVLRLNGTSGSWDAFGFPWNGRTSAEE